MSNPRHSVDLDLPSAIEFVLRQAAIYQSQMTPSLGLAGLAMSLYGYSISSDELQRFYLTAAPIARRVTLEVGSTDSARFRSDFAQRMEDLDRTDPTAARLVDLVYFTDFDLESASKLVGLPVARAHAKMRLAHRAIPARAKDVRRLR